MSTEMKKIDPFDLPDEFKERFLEKSLEDFDFEIDLHDDYDLVSQPLKEYFSSKVRGSIKNEGR